MKKLVMLKAFVIAVFLCGYSLAQESAVTYKCNHGRLGDQLTCYISARWMAHRYNLRFCYRPFKNSEKFAFHRLYEPFDLKEDSKQFAHVVKFPDLAGLQNRPDFRPESNTLYVIPFLGLCCDSMWNDESFLTLIRQEIASIEPLTPLQLPKDKHVVAVHVRSGIEYDKISEAKLLQCSGKARMKRWAGKFPPYVYYVEQIERLYHMLHDEPLYIHIFGDSPDLNSIARLFQETLNNPHIEFGFRSEGNGSRSNIMDDFFGLIQCDYLIRGTSNFSLVAEKLGFHKITISPYRLEEINKKSTVTQVSIRTRSGNETPTTVVPAGNFDVRRLCEAKKRIIDTFTLSSKDPDRGPQDSPSILRWINSLIFW
jgi:hypothetical protein